MKKNEWVENPALRDLDPAKLKSLVSFAEQANGKSQADLLPFLMAASKQSAKSGKLNFSPQEMETIFHVLKTGKSPAEIRRMDKLYQILKGMQH